VIILHVTDSVRIVPPADVFHTVTHLLDHRVTYELWQCVEQYYKHAHYL